jgi:hypothetical protein
MASPISKLPKDTFVPANQKENVSLPNYEAQVINPISTMNEAVRQELFSSKKTEVKERLVQVLSVDNDIKLPAQINYFSNQSILTEYGDRTFVSVIARINDADAGVPEPQLLVDTAGVATTLGFGDITRIKGHVGKFYAPKEDLAAKSIGNIEVGDWLIVEFQDKTNFQNGIIKKVYMKKNVSTYLASSAGAFGGSSATGVYSAGGATPAGPINLAGEAIFIGGSMSRLIARKLGAPDTTWNHSMYQPSSNLQFLNDALTNISAPLPAITKVIVNIGGNDGFQVNRPAINRLHDSLRRVFPSAPQYYLIRSPLHLGNKQYINNQTVPNNYYFDSGQFDGKAPPFFVIAPLIIAPQNAGPIDHAGTPTTWHWDGSAELLEVCRRILNGDSLNLGSTITGGSITVIPPTPSVSTPASPPTPSTTTVNPISPSP